MTKKELIEQGWATIEGFPNYRITVSGQVLTKYRSAEWRVMKPSIDRNGYSSQTIRNEHGPKFHLIHRLVAIAFIENPQGKREVNHIDGNKVNNRIENIEWASPSENRKHAFETGLHKGRLGSDNKASKLKESDVFEIKRMISLGMSNAEIGRAYSVKKETIFKIKHQISWKHVHYP